MNNILLSIIIPIKDISNWESNILENIYLFKKLNFNYEFLFVYSKPKDKSIKKLKKILKPRNIKSSKTAINMTINQIKKITE